MLYSRILLLIHSKCNYLHLSTPDSQSIPLPPTSIWQPQVCSPSPWVSFLWKVHLCCTLTYSLDKHHPVPFSRWTPAHPPVASSWTLSCPRLSFLSSPISNLSASPVNSLIKIYLKAELSFSFFQLYQWHTEVPRLGVESELQLLACATATARPDQSCICDLHCSLLQCLILNPLIEARNRTCILMDIRPGIVHPQRQLQVLNPLSHKGNSPELTIFFNISLATKVKANITSPLDYCALPDISASVSRWQSVLHRHYSSLIRFQSNQVTSPLRTLQGFPISPRLKSQACIDLKCATRAGFVYLSDLKYFSLVIATPACTFCFSWLQNSSPGHLQGSFSSAISSSLY